MKMQLWHGGRSRPRPYCARWGPSSPCPQKGAKPLIFGPCLLWPNGWMDQDGTWYGGRPRPSDVVLHGDPAPPKRCTAPVFGPCLLWPNGWMNEDATWSGSRPQSRPHCVRRGASSPRERGTAALPLFRPISTVSHLSYC